MDLISSILIYYLSPPPDTELVGGRIIFPGKWDYLSKGELRSDRLVLTIIQNGCSPFLESPASPDPSEDISDARYSHLLDKITFVYEKATNFARINTELIAQNNTLLQLLNEEADKRLHFEEEIVFLRSQNSNLLQLVNDGAFRQTYLEEQLMQLKSELDKVTDRIRKNEESSQNDYNNICELQGMAEEADKQLRTDFAEINLLKNEIEEINIWREFQQERLDQYEMQMERMEQYCTQDYFYIIRH